MITVGTKVSITDITDFFLYEGVVRKINDDKAIIIFPGKPGEYTYALDDLEEVIERVPHKIKKKKN
jgi:hypothetical protein